MIKMQKASSVKTLSIMDTLSELVQQQQQQQDQQGQLQQLTISPLMSSSSSSKNFVRSPKYSTPPPVPSPSNGNSMLQQPPKLKPRSPKVNVPSDSPIIKFASSSPNNNINNINNSGGKLDLSAIRSPPPLVPNGFTNGHHHHNASSSPSSFPNTYLGAKKKKKISNNSMLMSLAPSSPSSASVAPGGSNSSNNRGQQQTPDWIREIFRHAKNGAVDKLSASLEGFEPTLIRNLTEHTGDNLLHTVCAAGHANLLPWITRRFGGELNGALLADENSRGLTPAILAIKLGHLGCVQWLVRNTVLRERMERRENGQRTLLHHAAKYGKAEIASWLCEEMARADLPVDQLDTSGNSPLLLAARQGKMAAVAVLLQHGANVALKNSMGLRAYDCARLSGRKECAEYLLLFETSVGVSSQLLKATAEQEGLRGEHEELRTCFKEVLSVSKKLSKEREEMCRELSRLYDAMMELHNNMTMEIQVLASENNSLKRNKSKDEQQPNSLGSNSIDACTVLHERWQQNQKQWFSSGLVDSENRLLLAEESYRRNRNGNGNNNAVTNDTNGEDSYAHRLLRDRMEECRNHSRGLLLPSNLSLALPSDSSSSSSEAADSDAESQKRQSSEVAKLRRSMASRKKLATPPPPIKDKEDESVYSSLSNDMYSKIDGSDDTSINNGSNNKNERKKSREELRRKLMSSHALTSGTASVLEVIEPTSSEEEEFRQSMREMNISWSVASPTTNNNTNSSPTKRLMEMGVPAAALTNGSNIEKQRSSFFNKIAKWNKKKKGDEMAEEHVLPDNFEEEVEEEEDRLMQEEDQNRKSLSPSSRKSLYGSKTTLAVSVATSEDSGIVSNHKSPSNTLKLGKIEEVSVSSASRSSSTVQEVVNTTQEYHNSRKSNNLQLTPLSLLRKKSLESKAWYDVPSDDDAAAAAADEEEADSLASIISIRGGSSDED